jgi:cell wall-associated NlpC family hydrolase
VSGKAGIAVAAAHSVLGTPYRAFQSSPQTGFDCSGLTMWAWAQAGVHIPHQSAQQYATLPHVPIDQAQPGDLVFFYSPISHVGIYIGGGQMIDSPHTGAVVRIRAMRWDMVVGVARPG